MEKKRSCLIFLVSIILVACKNGYMQEKVLADFSSRRPDIASTFTAREWGGQLAVGNHNLSYTNSTLRITYTPKYYFDSVFPPFLSVNLNKLSSDFSGYQYINFILGSNAPRTQFVVHLREYSGERWTYGQILEAGAFITPKLISIPFSQFNFNPDKGNEAAMTENKRLDLNKIGLVELLFKIHAANQTGIFDISKVYLSRN